MSVRVAVNDEVADSLSSQIKRNLIPRTGLGSLTRLLVLLRVLFQNALPKAIKELLFLRAKLPITVSVVITRDSDAITHWMASNTACVPSFSFFAFSTSAFVRSSSFFLPSSLCTTSLSRVS